VGTGTGGGFGPLPDASLPSPSYGVVEPDPASMSIPVKFAAFGDVGLAFKTTNGEYMRIDHWPYGDGCALGSHTAPAGVPADGTAGAGDPATRDPPMILGTGTAGGAGSGGGGGTGASAGARADGSGGAGDSEGVGAGKTLCFPTEGFLSSADFWTSGVACETSDPSRQLRMRVEHFVSVLRMELAGRQPTCFISAFFWALSTSSSEALTLIRLPLRKQFSRAAAAFTDACSGNRNRRLARTGEAAVGPGSGGKAGANAGAGGAAFGPGSNSAPRACCCASPEAGLVAGLLALLSCRSFVRILGLFSAVHLLVGEVLLTVGGALFSC
jgi:hypothetical protein